MKILNFKKYIKILFNFGIFAFVSTLLSRFRINFNLKIKVVRNVENKDLTNKSLNSISVKNINFNYLRNKVAKYAKWSLKVVTN
mgnify:CR=1 FL=1